MKKKTKLIIPAGGTAAMIAFLLIYFIITVYSTVQFHNQALMIAEHPFTSTRMIGDLKAIIAKMQVKEERLQSYNAPSDVFQVRNTYVELYEEAEEILSQLGDIYLGPSENMEVLLRVYEEINQKQKELLEFALSPDHDLNEISVFEEGNLMPLYEDFDFVTDAILNDANKRQISILKASDSLQARTLIFSAIMVAIAIAVILLYQILLNKQYKELHLTKKQFDVLSNTIDETFLIFDHHQEGCELVSENCQKILGIRADELERDRSLLFRNVEESNRNELIQKVSTIKRDEPCEALFTYYHPVTGIECKMWIRCYLVAPVRKMSKIVALIMDKSEEYRAGRNLQDALEAANHANDAKRQFLSRMSHEIRTPLNAVIGMTEIALVSMDQKERILDCLKKIRYSSGHLLALINDILDMSKIESNKMQLIRESFDLCELTDALAGIISPQANEKEIIFLEERNGWEGEACYIGDTLRLKQILLNLLSNAVKFTPAGGCVTMEVTKLGSKGDRDQIRFVVRDTGIGMDREAMERIFNPFEQADSTISRNYGGTGLGMSISKNLVMLMGGFVDVKSEPEKGTVCTVEIALERSGRVIENIHQSRQEKDLGRDIQLQGRTILVAEDNELNMEIQESLLQMKGASVRKAKNGKEALEMFQAAAPGTLDAILMDIQMPVMDGYEAAKAIRACAHPEAGTIPIIAATANAFSEDVAAALAAGMNAHVGKPIDIKELCRTLIRCFR